MTNISNHPCSGKCSEYKEEQCKHCLIPNSTEANNNLSGAIFCGWDLAAGDDQHIEYIISPKCRVMDSEESVHFLRALEAKREVS